MSRGLQVFIHRNYDLIKLVALGIILTVVMLAFYSQLTSTADNTKRRGEAVLEIVRTIKDENEKQTIIINRQFQALCFLLVETSGIEALKQLDPPLEQQCLDLASELREQERNRQAVTEGTSSTGTTNSPAPAPPSSRPAAPTTGTPSQPDRDFGPLLQPTVDLLEFLL